MRLDTANGILRELGRVYRQARSGALPLGDATRLAFILSTMVKVVELTEFENRIERIEASYENDDTRATSSH